MATAFATSDDVAAALLRPLTEQESQYVAQLLISASALLRNASPALDSRIALYESDPTTPRAVDPDVVAAVAAGIVKRYLVNPKGLASTTEGVGPYSHGETYALRAEADVRGVMQVTAEDLATLTPNRRRLRAGSIRTRPGLAPRPVGHYGGIPSLPEAVSAVVTFAPDLSDLLPDAEGLLGPVS